jgi:hypothetical protein
MQYAWCVKTAPQTPALGASTGGGGAASLSTNIFAVFLLRLKPSGAASRGCTHHSATVRNGHLGGWRAIVRATITSRPLRRFGRDYNDEREVAGCKWMDCGSP